LKDDLIRFWEAKAGSGRIIMKKELLASVLAGLCFISSSPFARDFNRNRCPGPGHFGIKLGKKRFRLSKQG